VLYSRIYPFRGGGKQVTAEWNVGFENKFVVLKINGGELKIKMEI
jgi:hypothetical protein